MINYNKLNQIYENEIKNPTINKRKFGSKIFSMIYTAKDLDEARDVKTIMNARCYRFINVKDGIDVYIQR